MAKKKNITAAKIIEMYMDEILMNEVHSKSVYAFAKKNNFDESLFYEHFNSFESLEKEIFATFCTETIHLLDKTEEFSTYDVKTKLLSFYFTFFEILSANRSYVFLRLKQHNNALESLKMLKRMRKVFLNFAKSLHVETIDLKNDKANKIQRKGIEESMWIQLLMTIQFWLNDDSKGFEKTDIYIEKSIKAQFDVMDVMPVKSVLDFAKFLWKEKTMNR